MHTVTKTDRSWPLVLVVLLAAAALFCALVAWAVPGLGACGGDGGSPAARPESTLAGVCDKRAAWTPVMLFGPLMCVVVGGVVGKMVRHWWPAALGFLLAALIIVVPFVIIAVVDGPSQRAGATKRAVIQHA
jgi:hypothetical protein